MIQFGFIDILIIIFFLVLSFLIPLLFTKTEKNISAYFGSNGKLNWFVSGTAMVATTFAADTPLAVTELVAKYGISGNWLWWYGSISTIVTVYFFSHLWKNSGVLTDVELVTLRYSGIGSVLLRGFKSIYLGFFMNILILSWVNLAMLKVISVLLPEFSPKIILSLLFLFAFFYTSFFGLTGISIVDTFQFFFAMLGCILLAYFSVNSDEIGGVQGLLNKLPKETFNFIPDFSNPSSKEFSIQSFLVFITIIWWSSWYPGAEPGGGGYIAQRMLSSRDSKSSMLASLYFTIAHYFIRPWPWILIALVSIIYFPNLPAEEKGKGFVLILSKINYSGLTGLVFAVFIAAYLSTVATHLNWGTSYLIHDLIKPFLLKNKKDSDYIKISYLFQLVMMIISLLISFYFIKSISGVWEFLLESCAGVGLVLILRWYIPRLNAWSELTGFISPFIYYNFFKFYTDFQSPYTIILTVFFVSLTIIIITFLTKNTNTENLILFYNKVKPPGIFWKRWAIKNNQQILESEISIYKSIFLCILGILMIFSGLFSVGNLLFGFWNKFLISFPILLVSVFFTFKFFPRLK